MQESANTWQSLSNEIATAVERISPAVVAVHARRRIPSSGVYWKAGIIVTADHTVKRDEEIAITLPDGTNASATLAGRDPSTDVAILRIDAKAATGGLSVAESGDLSALKVGHSVLLAARTAEGGARASLAVVGVVGPAWRTWRGGTIDSTIRLDRSLHPNYSGGPVVASNGRVLGVATAGLSRYGGVVVPSATIERVTAELERKGHIGRGFLGIGMAPVRIPRKVRESLKLDQDTGILVMGVEADSPAEKAGVALGDLFVALEGSPVRDTDDVQGLLSSDRIGKPAKASIIRGGSLAELMITVGERPLG